jgi:LysM repeat protein
MALATMIEDAKAGNPVLWQFIYAQLKYIQKHFSNARDEKIKTIINASDNDLARITTSRLQRLIEIFSSKIGGPLGEKQEGQITQTSIRPPIGRYEPVLDVSIEERSRLEVSYFAEIQVPVNPLITVYFLQVLHAQTIGNYLSPIAKREFVSAGLCTNAAIKKWAKHSIEYSPTINTVYKSYQSSIPFVPELKKTIAPKEVQKLKERLSLRLESLVRDIFHPDWVRVVLAATDIIVDIAISAAETGTITPDSIVLAIVGFASAELIGRSLTDPHLSKRERVLRFSAGIAILLCIFLYYGIPRIKSLICSCDPSGTETAIQSSLQISTPAETAPAVISTQTPTITLTQEILPPTPFPTTTVPTSPYLRTEQYCKYVIQPHDTLQSVVARFQVTEYDLRSWNGSIAQGVFVVNQLIVLNVSCCRPIGDLGFSYTVDFDDTSYSIAKRYSITTDALVYANNLYDVRYIQAGQMLCIPYP